MGIVMTQEMVLVNISHYKIAKYSAPLPLHGIVLALEIVKTLEMDLVSICQYKIAKTIVQLQLGIAMLKEIAMIQEMGKAYTLVLQGVKAFVLYQLQRGIVLALEIVKI